MSKNTLVSFDPVKHEPRDNLQGFAHVDVIRKAATKVLGKDVDLKQTEQIELSRLPDDIKQDLIGIFKRIENLL